ncbi:MAG: hypothetical protein GY711_01595 [bacterium]|nr:hypothetical protein [bacterium]
MRIPSKTPVTTLALLAAAALAFPMFGACPSTGGDSSGDSGSKALSISGVEVAVGQTVATISWSTNRMSDSEVEYGTTNTYGELIQEANAVKQHSIELSGLTAATDYHFRVSSTRGSDRATSSDFTFRTDPLGAPGATTSDDFSSANLDLALWQFSDPVGGASVRIVGAGTGDGQVEIEVPAGTPYNPWEDNEAAHITQAVVDTHMSVEAKFTNALDAEGTGSGIVFEEDDDDFVRFDFIFNSGNVEAFAASFEDGSLVDVFSQPVVFGTWLDGNPLYMRVVRSDDNWIQLYSFDGVVWTTAATFTFDIAVARVGLFAASGGSPAPGHTMRADYFMDVFAPISPEDGGSPTDTTAPSQYRIESEPLDDSSIRIAWWTDELATATVQYGLDTTYAGGSIDLLSAAHNHQLDLTDLDDDTEYHFRIRSEDAAGNTVWSGDLTERTYPDGVDGFPAIALWYGSELPSGENVQRFGQLGNPQAQVNVIGNLTDGDEARIVDTVTLHYRLNGGSWTQLALGDDRTVSYAPWRLANEGDFNVELYVGNLTSAPLIAGVHRNELELVAQDDENHIVYRTIYVDYAPGVTWNPSPFVLDWSDVLTNQAGDLQSACQVVDGKWYVDDHPTLGPGLRQDAGAFGYDRLVTIGEADGADAWENYEVTVPVTVLSFDPQGYTTGTQSYAFGFVMRWSGHTQGGPYSQPTHDIYPLGGGFFYRWFDNTERWELWVNENETIVPLSGGQVQLGVTYLYKLRCETQPAGGTRYRMKLWQLGQAEPAGWSYDYTTTAIADHPDGSLLLVAHHVDAHFGNVTVTQLP